MGRRTIAHDTPLGVCIAAVELVSGRALPQVKFTAILEAGHVELLRPPMGVTGERLKTCCRHHQKGRVTSDY
jgi:hypothetical protein